MMLCIDANAFTGGLNKHINYLLFKLLFPLECLIDSMVGNWIERIKMCKDKWRVNKRKRV